MISATAPRTVSARIRHLYLAIAFGLVIGMIPIAIGPAEATGGPPEERGRSGQVTPPGQEVSNESRGGGREAGSSGRGNGAPADQAAVPFDPAKLRLPMTFEENQGQIDETVDFFARGQGYQVFLTEGDAVIALGNGNSRYAIRMDAVDGATSPEVVTHGRQPGHTNYLIGNDPAQWQTNVPSFAAVEYQEVYPGIDLRYYGNDRQLEYDFIVQPGADPRQIALTFDGATGLAVTEAGDLEIGLNPGRTVTFSAPISFQDNDGQRVPIDSAYTLDGDTVSFAVGEYDPNLPLVIDPTLEYDPDSDQPRLVASKGLYLPFLPSLGIHVSF